MAEASGRADLTATPLPGHPLLLFYSMRRLRLAHRLVLVSLCAVVSAPGFGGDGSGRTRGRAARLTRAVSLRSSEWHGVIEHREPDVEHREHSVAPTVPDEAVAADTGAAAAAHGAAAALAPTTFSLPALEPGSLLPAPRSPAHAVGVPTSRTGRSPPPAFA